MNRFKKVFRFRVKARWPFFFKKKESISNTALMELPYDFEVDYYQSVARESVTLSGRADRRPDSQ